MAEDERELERERDQVAQRVEEPVGQAHRRGEGARDEHRGERDREQQEGDLEIRWPQSSWGGGARRAPLPFRCGCYGLPATRSITYEVKSTSWS